MTRVLAARCDRVIELVDGQVSRDGAADVVLDKR